MPDEVAPEDVDTQPMDVVEPAPLVVTEPTLALREPPPPCSTCG